MPSRLDIDERAPLLPFDPKEVDRSGLRLLPAEFARLMGCTRQCVSQWVKAGKISVGVDGRVEPRQAVAQLLRHSDPARLRSKILAPMVTEVTALRKRVVELESALAIARENLDFEEGVNGELIGQWNALFYHLNVEWPDLRALPISQAQYALDAWRVGVEESQFDSATGITTLVNLSVRDAAAEGEEDEGHKIAASSAGNDSEAGA